MRRRWGKVFYEEEELICFDLSDRKNIRLNLNLQLKVNFIALVMSA